MFADCTGKATIPAGFVRTCSRPLPLLLVCHIDNIGFVPCKLHLSQSEHCRNDLEESPHLTGAEADGVEHCLSRYPSLPIVGLRGQAVECPFCEVHRSCVTIRRPLIKTVSLALLRARAGKELVEHMVVALTLGLLYHARLLEQVALQGT